MTIPAAYIDHPSARDREAGERPVIGIRTFTPKGAARDHLLSDGEALQIAAKLVEFVRIRQQI